jgi:hypothetical protein
MKRELSNNVSERSTVSIFRDEDKAAREETVEMLWKEASNGEHNDNFLRKVGIYLLDCTAWRFRIYIHDVRSCNYLHHEKYAVLNFKTDFLAENRGSSYGGTLYRVRQANFLFWIWNAIWKRKLACRTLYYMQVLKKSLMFRCLYLIGSCNTQGRNELSVFWPITKTFPSRKQRISGYQLNFSLVSNS